LRLPPTKRLVQAGALLAAAVAAALWLLRGSTPQGAPRYETAPVIRGRVASTVTANGTVSPTVTVQVGSQISGRIQELLADFNSRVKKGDLVARIDPSLFESQVAQARAGEAMARAAVTSAEAALVEARRQHQRVADLVAKSMASTAESDTTLAQLQAAESELASAKARVEQARAQRLQAETNLAYTTIRSPIDGIVISRDVDVGQTVAASLQAPTLYTIAEDLRRMELHTSVAESDVGQLRDGMPVEFTVDAFPGEKFRGSVREVRFAPKTVQNVVTYDAVVTVDNGDLKLRPGMTATVSFIVEELSDALLVPNAALRFRPPDEVLARARERREGARSGERGGSAAAGRRGAGETRRGQEAAPEPGAAQAGGAAPPERGVLERRGGRRPVWLVSASGELEPRFVVAGPSDGKNTAVVAGELGEGDAVVVGTAGSGKDARGPAAGPPRFGRFL
jgi:HlyD family secretion protein